MNYESYIPTFRGNLAGRWFYGRLVELGKVKSVLADDNNNGKLAKVETATLSISTGLKDTNGTMIYDGDILDFRGDKVLVYWNGECFQWKIKYLEYFGEIEEGCDELGWVAAEVPILGRMTTKVIGNRWNNSDWLPMNETMNVNMMPSAF